MMLNLFDESVTNYARAEHSARDTAPEQSCETGDGDNSGAVAAHEDLQEDDSLVFSGFGEGILGCITAAEEYLTIEEVAERLKLSPKTVRNKMASGVLSKGTHYFSPRGLGPRFKWSAVEKWIESEGVVTVEEQADDEIPMARGYALGRTQLVEQNLRNEKRTTEN